VSFNFSFFDKITTSTDLAQKYKNNIFINLFESNELLNIFFYNYSNLYYNIILNFSYSYLNYNYINTLILTNYFYFFNFLTTFFKLNIIIFILYSIFFSKYLNNYFKSLITHNFFSKLTILNEVEKEVGPVDDFIFFSLLFITTIGFFIFITINVIIFHSNFFTWINTSFALLGFLFLTLPINLFFDYGISFVAYIKGSASGSNFIKELVFDIIGTFTVFIRFIIQNIRFLFILLAIFELLEWVINNTNNLIFSNIALQNNFFTEINNNNSNINVLIINSILFIFAYFYYFLHLLFLLLVQITIYIGISAWLFFFLYSTKFLSKYEKFFFKK